MEGVSYIVVAEVGECIGLDREVVTEKGLLYRKQMDGFWRPQLPPSLNMHYYNHSFLTDYLLINSRL